MGVHSACPLDCDCTDYMIVVLRLVGVQKWEDPWRDLKKMGAKDYLHKPAKSNACNEQPWVYPDISLSISKRLVKQAKHGNRLLCQKIFLELITIPNFTYILRPVGLQLS